MEKPEAFRGHPQLKTVAIGSCRVYEPLKIAVEQGLLSDARPLFPHVHNPVEILQCLDLLDGRKPIQRDIAPLLNAKKSALFDGRDHLTPRLARADVAVVELSSIRLIEFDGWSLQINKVRNRLTAAGLSAAQIASFIADAESFRANPKLDIQSISDEVARNLLLRGVTHELSAEELETWINRIRERLSTPRHLLLVGFFSDRKSGDPIAQRRLINETTRAYAEKTENTAFFDPTPLVALHGMEAALLDMGHYRTEFQPVVAVALASAIGALVNVGHCPPAS